MTTIIPGWNLQSSRVCLYLYVWAYPALWSSFSSSFLMGAPCWVIGGEIGRDGRRRRASRRRRRDSHSTGNPPAYRPTHVGNRGESKEGSSRNTLPMCISAARDRDRELLLRIREVPGSFPRRTGYLPTRLRLLVDFSVTPVLRCDCFLPHAFQCVIW